MPNKKIKIIGNPKSNPTYLLRRWNIHDNQVIAAKKILFNYSKGLNYCILVAQMQSGKTGTAKYICYYLQHDKHELGSINADKTYFICGMNDNDLRNQAVSEFKDLIPESNILFSKQLQKINKSNETSDTSDSDTDIDLLIIDESHYGSNKNSQLEQFQNKMGKNARYILSVSATPMAEVASQCKYGKGLVELNPGEGYYGLSDIFRNGLISQSVSLSTDEGLQFLYDVIDDELERDDPKYCIVRLPSQWYRSETEEDILECYSEIKFINHHSDYSTEADFNNYLKVKPETTTIIWIYNALRAGKQLETENIGFVYDTSDSKADIIAQSLLGRIFGYEKENHKVQCYTDMKAAHKMLNWINSLYCKESIPNGSKNIQNGYSDKVQKWNIHPPIIIDFQKKRSDEYYRLKITHHNRYPYKDDFIADLLEYSNPEDLVKIEEIIDDYAPGKCGGLMVLNEENTARSFKCHWDFNYNASLENKPVRGFDTTNESSDEDKFYYVYYNLNTNTNSYSKAMLVYKERINAPREAEHVKPSSKSMYS